MIEVEWRVCGTCGNDWKSSGRLNCPVCLSDNTMAVDDGFAHGDCCGHCALPLLDDEGEPIR